MAKKGGPTIGQLAKKCKTAFDKLQEDLESMGGDDAVAVRDEKARFNIWIDTAMPQKFFGISRLDYQLRDSESLKTKVKSLLKKLNDVLEQARGPDVEEVDSAPSDEEVVDDLAGQRSSGQARQIRRARRLVDMLLRLSGSLKQPAPDDLIKSGALSGGELKHDSDIEKVRTQFPRIPPFLAERLGKAISKRRQYFIFKANYEDFENHDTERERSKKEDTETERREREVLPNENTEKRHLERMVDIEEPALSNGVLSVELLDAHAKSNHLQSVGPAPGEQIELAISTDLPPGARVKCPLCFESYRPDDASFWDIHLEDDISAYLCTWEHCPIGPHMYRRLGDWQHHENTAHRRIWKCPFECDVISETSFDFAEHVKTNHETSEDPEVLKSLVEACSRPAEPMEDLHCPMCESPIATYEAWYRHVGAHLKRLSCFSLPAHLVRVTRQADGEDAPSESITDGPPVEDDGDVVIGNSGDARPVHGTGRHATVESDETEPVGNYSDVEEIESVGRLENITIEELPVEESKDHAEDIEIRETVGRRSSIRERSESPSLSIRVEKHLSRSPSRERVVRIVERGERWDRERFKHRRVVSGESSEEEIVRRYEEPSNGENRRRYRYQELDLPMMREVDLTITRKGEGWGRDARNRQRNGTQEEDAKDDKENQYEEFVRQYERQQAIKQMKKLEMEARFKKEFEEKQAREAKDRAEAEERVKIEMKLREEQKKHKEEQDEKKLDEKMRKRLATFGFTDHQIRSIMNQDEPEKQGRGFERNDRLWEREYYAPSRDYHAPVRDDYSPVREEYVPEREYRTRARRAPAPPPSRPSQFDPDEYQEPIRFEDAEYRRYKLPWKVAKTWKGMQKIVREIYQNSETRDMDEDIIGGHWQILDADDNGILPSSWELTAKPGHVYRLAFTRPPGGRRDDESPFRKPGDDIVEVVEEHARPRRNRSPTGLREATRDAPTELILEKRDDTSHRRKSRRAPSNKAVSWDPYIDDEAGWYPSLESATRGGFRRPGKEPEQHNLSYAYPQSSNITAQGRRPTYVKVHRGHVAPETLRYYDLPWEYDHSDPSHIIILRDMDPRETDILFEHTRRLRERNSLPVTAGPSSRGENLAMVDTLGVRPQ